MLNILKGDIRVLIFASELGTRVKKVRCLSTQLCGWYIDLLGHMMAHSYMCFHRVKHTYVYRCMHVCSIHILNICIGRTYAPVYISCIFVLALLIPRYVYLNIYIGCSYDRIVGACLVREKL